MNINDFGRKSFVTHTTGLVERIEKMTEHLFKLKKDGKTVGYLEIRILTPYGYPVLWFRNLNRLDEGREWHSGNNIQGDSLHAFVTKDKNGKDVFAGDKLRSGKRVLTVVWDEESLQWRAKEDSYTYLTPICQWAISEQFELIEDKEDA